MHFCGNLSLKNTSGLEYLVLSEAFETIEIRETICSIGTGAMLWI